MGRPGIKVMSLEGKDKAQSIFGFATTYYTMTMLQYDTLQASDSKRNNNKARSSADIPGMMKTRSFEFPLHNPSMLLLNFFVWNNNAWVGHLEDNSRHVKNILSHGAHVLHGDGKSFWSSWTAHAGFNSAQHSHTFHRHSTGSCRFFMVFLCFICFSDLALLASWDHP